MRHWSLSHAPRQGPADVAEADLGHLGHDAVDGHAGLLSGSADQLVDAGPDLVIPCQARRFGLRELIARSW